jgi:hypothetical protein
LLCFSAIRGDFGSGLQNSCRLHLEFEKGVVPGISEASRNHHELLEKDFTNAAICVSCRGLLGEVRSCDSVWKSGANLKNVMA